MNDRQFDGIAFPVWVGADGDVVSLTFDVWYDNRNLVPLGEHGDFNRSRFDARSAEGGDGDDHWRGER
ncbi:MAG: hypothetical protein IIC51_02655 [Planctomycetes bacterium]|nr:hypothetical protein [Planctomycetota bacterium]